ncbi:MAG: beta-galactosidase trimerization domain-containing protein [Planctomycetota bacterium]
MHQLRYRQIHLDFHTSPHITGIGEAFDEKQWQETLKRGHVDSVTLFATCHHGYAYYDTKVGERHPHLNFDLLRRQFDATKAIGVNAPIYLTAGVNNWAAENHPEWREMGPDGRLTGWSRSNLDAGFFRMCFNTPYLDLLCDQISEVVTLFPDCDGIFLDIISQTGCVCHYCIASMHEAGLDPTNPADRQKSAEMNLLKYYRATTAAARINDPDMPIFHNSGHIQPGERGILPYFSHLELESLPTGGWGYDHFPMSARYVAQLPHDALGMTGKFHTTWGEFGGYKHPNALRYECAAMLAHGTKCSVGDQLHPSGKLDESTYDLIGAAYAEVEAKEPYINDAVNVADIALLSSAAMNPDAGREAFPDTGAGRLLLEGQYLFDILDAEMDFNPYRLLILPDDIAVDPTLKAKLDAYLEQGGRLLLSGTSGLNADQTESVFDLGADLLGPSSYQPDFILPIPVLRPEFVQSPLVMYSPPTRIRATTGTPLGAVYASYFNRSYKHFCSHQHAPYQTQPSGDHLGVMHGPITYLAHPVFTLYAAYGAVAYRHLITNAIDLALGTADQPRTVTTNLPSTARITLTHQPNESRYVLHLLYANTVQRGATLELSGGTTRATQPISIIEELNPLHDTTVELHNLPLAGSAHAVVADQAVPVETFPDGGLRLSLDRFNCHEIITLPTA